MKRRNYRVVEKFDEGVAKVRRDRNLELLARHGIDSAADFEKPEILKALSEISAESRLKKLKGDFDETGNPFYVWSAILVSSASWNGEPRSALPDWVRDYLAGCAFEIERIGASRSPPNDLPKKVSAAFGFQGKVHNSLRRRVTSERAKGVRRDARLALDGCVSKTEIDEIVAEKFALSSKTLQKKKKAP